MGPIEVRTGSEMVSTRQIRTRGARPPRLAPVKSRLPGEVVPLDTSTVQNIIQLPATVNLEIYQGDDFFLDMTVMDVNSNFIDLTNSVPMSQIRAAPDAQTILAQLVITIDTSVLGLLHIHLNASDSNLLPPLPAILAWDIQLTDPYITTLAAGTVSVVPQVTI